MKVIMDIIDTSKPTSHVKKKVQALESMKEFMNLVLRVLDWRKPKLDTHNYLKSLMDHKTVRDNWGQ